MKLAILLLTAITSLHSQGDLSHTSGPIIIHKTQPQYTKKARDAKIEGAVRLLAVVGTDGVASDIKVDRGLGLGLDEKAVECLKEWRFKPATDHFVPVSAEATIEITFRLFPLEPK